MDSKNSFFQYSNGIKLKFIYFFISFSLAVCCSSKSKNTTEKIINLEKISIDSINLKIYNKNYLMGKFDYKSDSSFSIAPSIYTYKTIFLKKVVLDSFIKMAEEAKKSEINLKIISGTRNFFEQKGIWERKWNNLSGLTDIEKAKKILEFSSMPSTSRHHWGTEIDVNNLNNSYFSKGQGLKEYTWLVENADKFGFFQPYTSKNNGRTGYNEEKWHWSFKPISYQCLKVFKDSISHEDINDFLGHNTAPKIDVIPNYVDGIEY